MVLAVKPHLVTDVLQEISDFLTKEKMFVSIAAGVPLEVLESVSSRGEGAGVPLELLESVSSRGDVRNGVYDCK